jgi:phage tail sheath gpL-like
VFEFDVAGDGVAGGNIQVNVSTDTSAEDVAARMRTAINGVVGGLAITAAAGTTAVVSLKNDAVGVAGNVAITDTVLDAGFVVAGMSGGVDAVSSRVRVNISASVTAGDVRDALLAQISAQDLAIAAVTSGAASIALTHLVAGTVGNKAMSDTVVSAGFTTSGMSGGAETVDGAALSSSPVWVSWFALGK